MEEDDDISSCPEKIEKKVETETKEKEEKIEKKEERGDKEEKGETDEAKTDQVTEEETNNGDS